MNLQSHQILEKIQRMKCQLQKYLEVQEYQILCHFQKQTCSKLAYFIKYIQLHKPQSDILLNCLAKGLRMIAVMLKSTSFQKYGHKLKHYAFILRRYEQISNSKVVIINNQKVLAREYRNQQSQYYRDIQQTQIQTQEVYFPKSETFNNFIKELSQNEIILQNTQCICCSQVFIKNYVIDNKNPYIPFTAQLSSKIAFQKNLLGRQLSAMCNKGGGVLLIGAQRKQGLIRAAGIKFHDQNSVKNKQQYILSVIQNVKPSCQFLIQRVIVQTNMITKELPLSEYLRFCFRILIFPNSVNKVTYFQQNCKKNQKKCEVYIYKRNSRQSQNIPPQELYQRMHETYTQKSKKRKNSHENIYCTRPHLNYSKLFYEQYYKKKEQKYEEASTINLQECPQQQCQFQEQVEKDPIFTLKEQCLLITASKNYIKRVQKFMGYLSENQQKYQLSKPYSQTFKDCIRSVWMISHQMRFAEIKDMLKDYEKRNQVPSSQIITIMPVQPILQVLASKFTEYCQTCLKDQMRARFQCNNLYEKKKFQFYDYKHKQLKKVYYLKFENKVKSLYAYLFFEKLNLRPYFVNKNDCQANF